MMLPSETSGANSPSTSSSENDSLLAHASSETDSEKEGFLTPKESVSSASSTSSSEDSPQKESVEFLPPGEHTFWKNEIIRAFRDALDFHDRRGKIATIQDNEILASLNITSLLSKKEAETICEKLRKLPWPDFEKADRTSVYAKAWQLLEKHQRPDID